VVNSSEFFIVYRILSLLFIWAIHTNIPIRINKMVSLLSLIYFLY
jgi:hypothetical protein